MTTESPGADARSASENVGKLWVNVQKMFDISLILAYNHSMCAGGRYVTRSSRDNWCSRRESII